MEALFLRILKMSLAGAAVILLILPLRLLLRNAPKRFSYLLWAAAAFRLCVPASLPSPFSLFRLLSGTPAAPSAPGPLDLPFPVEAAPAAAEAAVSAGVQAAAAQPSPAVSAAVGASAFPWLRLLALVWLAGVAALLLYGLIVDLRLRRRLRTAIRQEDGSWRASGITTPFLLGLLRPRIYLPWGLEGTDRDLALEHEKAHLRRGDPWWRLLGWLLLCLHWFNPLCWLAFLLAGRDMELSCDEAVLARRGKAGEYSESLLRIAEKGRPLSPLPLAFGELGVRQRVKNALRWKPARGWASAMLALLCLLFFAACATDPKALTPAKTELTLNADGTVGPFRWAMTPEEAAEAWPGLTLYENEKQTRISADLKEVTILGHTADVRLFFPKHSMEGGRQHHDKDGYPTLEEIHITIPESVDLTEDLTAVLGEREKRRVEDHLGPEHEYIDGKPRPYFHEEELPEEDWYWHSYGVLTDMVTADQLRLLQPQWKNDPDQKLLEAYCSYFDWETHCYVDRFYYVSRENYPDGVTEIYSVGYSYVWQRFLEYLEANEGEGGA